MLRCRSSRSRRGTGRSRRSASRPATRTSAARVSGRGSSAPRTFRDRGRVRLAAGAASVSLPPFRRISGYELWMSSGPGQLEYSSDHRNGRSAFANPGGGCTRTEAPFAGDSVVVDAAPAVSAATPTARNAATDEQSRRCRSPVANPTDLVRTIQPCSSCGAGQRTPSGAGSRMTGTSVSAVEATVTWMAVGSRTQAIRLRARSRSSSYWNAAAWAGVP